MQQRGGSCDANLMQDANPSWFSCSSCRLSVNAAPPNFTMAAQVGAEDAMDPSSKAMQQRYSDDIARKCYSRFEDDYDGCSQLGRRLQRKGPTAAAGNLFLPTFGIPQTCTARVNGPKKSTTN
jgi:hypothetical protein